jgi:hypothetical protein
MWMVYIYSMKTRIEIKQLIPVAARSKAWDCGRWLGMTVGSNYAGKIDVSFL